MVESPTAQYAVNLFNDTFNLFAPDLYSKLPELVLITLSIVAYGIMIYRFYKFVAKRDVFGLDVSKYHSERTGFFALLWKFILSLMKYGILFPIFVFIWFAGFAVLLSVMAKTLPTDQILLISITFVTAIRITSYITEDMAKDLAKLIPLALLGIAIVAPDFFSLTLAQEKIFEIVRLVPQSFSFLLFIVLIEWIMRLLLSFKHYAFGFSQKKEEGN